MNHTEEMRENICTIQKEYVTNAEHTYEATSIKTTPRDRLDAPPH